MINRRGMAGHENPVNVKDEWLTPPEIVRALGPFDLDPCAPIVRPWPTARRHYTMRDDGLRRTWRGRVWCNPPYGRRSIIGPWCQRMAEHNCGTMLIFARVETQTFFEAVWERASALLFLRGRVEFHHVDGEPAGNNAGAPSVLVAYGALDARRLEASGLDGKFIALRLTAPLCKTCKRRRK